MWCVMAALGQAPGRRARVSGCSLRPGTPILMSYSGGEICDLLCISVRSEVRLVFQVTSCKGKFFVPSLIGRRPIGNYRVLSVSCFSL